MDCTSLCLLALAVGLRASLDTKKCSYCVDVRALNAHCDAEPLRCAFGANAQRDALIYCLTVVETVRDDAATVRRVLRCVSGAAFNLTIAEFRAAATLRECQFDALQECDCPNCRHSGETERRYGQNTSTTTVAATSIISEIIPSLTYGTTSTTVSSMLLRSLKIQRISTRKLDPTTVKPSLRGDHYRKSVRVTSRRELLTPLASATFALQNFSEFTKIAPYYQYIFMLTVTLAFNLLSFSDFSKFKL